MSDKHLLTTKEAATYLNVSTETLKTWRAKGLAISYLKIGDGKSSKCMYRKCDLDAFIDSRLQKVA
ncbi:MAG: helix-turn-helix domain-containing protein [Campylobacteraceae bacterium]